MSNVPWSNDEEKAEYWKSAFLTERAENEELKKKQDVKKMSLEELDILDSAIHREKNRREGQRLACRVMPENMADSCIDCDYVLDCVELDEEEDKPCDCGCAKTKGIMNCAICMNPCD